MLSKIRTLAACILNGVSKSDIVRRIVVLAYLSYKGWVDVKWTAMEDTSRSTLTNAPLQVVNDTTIFH
jgi:hypothetical protein